MYKFMVARAGGGIVWDLPQGKVDAPTIAYDPTFLTGQLVVTKEAAAGNGVPAGLRRSPALHNKSWAVIEAVN